ncbi:MAG TPA: phosphonate utilization associated transcriptional regulator [Usitatibacteraceae bacterium]|nr:phosphonate utilization associated transcriptional regulator [Usitatibacteraceae bacterium]
MNARDSGSRPGAAPLSHLEILQSRSLPMLLQRELERMILTGELAVGARLNESALALRLGVSRGPIREACRALEESGLVRMEKNRGVFVREISVAEADAIYDVREALEELVGRKLAGRIGDAERKELHALLDEMDKATRAKKADRYHPLNLKFHDRLVELTGNAMLIAIYRRLIRELHLFRLRGLADGGGLPVSNEEHRAIVTAIEKGNAEKAGKALREHARLSRNRIHRALGAPLSEPTQEPA